MSPSRPSLRRHSHTRMHRARERSSLLLAPSMVLPCCSLQRPSLLLCFAPSSAPSAMAAPQASAAAAARDAVPSPRSLSVAPPVAGDLRQPPVAPVLELVRLLKPPRLAFDLGLRVPWPRAPSAAGSGRPAESLSALLHLVSGSVRRSHASWCPQPRRRCSSSTLPPRTSSARQVPPRPSPPRRPCCCC